MPQVAQGSGYSLQSFLKKNQKRISTSIPHAKSTAVKKTSVIHLPWPPKPDGTDAGKALLFLSMISAGGTAGLNQTEALLELLSKKTCRVVNFNGQFVRKLTTLESIIN